MLPLRAGSVHVQFTPRGGETSHVRTSLMGKLSVTNVCSRLEARAPGSATAVMPVGLDASQEVLLRVGLPADKSTITHG